MYYEVINSIYNWNWYEFLKFKMINGLYVFVSNMFGVFDCRIDWNIIYIY